MTLRKLLALALCFALVACQPVTPGPGPAPTPEPFPVPGPSPGPSPRPDPRPDPAPSGSVSESDFSAVPLGSTEAQVVASLGTPYRRAGIAGDSLSIAYRVSTGGGVRIGEFVLTGGRVTARNLW